LLHCIIWGNNGKKNVYTWSGQTQLSFEYFCSVVGPDQSRDVEPVGIKAVLFASREKSGSL
jgi:hypothetical protein